MEIQQQRYVTWKKNSPLLYHQLQTSSLLWPSLSLDWLPDATSNTETDAYDEHRLLLSTFSDGISPLESLLLTKLNLIDLNSSNVRNLQNYDFLPTTNEFIYSLPLPHLTNTKELTEVTNPDNVIPENAQHTTEPIPTSTSSNTPDEISNEKNIIKPKVNNSLGLIQRIPHLGDIHRIKHCPHNLDLIATSSDSGSIRIFDRTKKPNNYNDSEFEGNLLETSDILLNYHNSASWTLDWNLQSPYKLAAAADDGSISIWNLKDQFKAPPKQKFSTLDSKYKFNTCTLKSPQLSIPAHNFGVNEIRWVQDHDSILVSAGEDGTIKVWDTRNSSESPILTFFDAKPNETPLNTVDIDPFQTFKLVSGSSVGSLHFLDMRNPNQIISSENQHSGPITSSKYSPHLKDTIATSSADATATIWVNNEPVFVHSGHLMSVSDLVWCPSKKGVLASCSYDNSVHIWQPIL